MRSCVSSVFFQEIPEEDLCSSRKRSNGTAGIFHYLTVFRHQLPWAYHILYYLLLIKDQTPTKDHSGDAQGDIGEMYLLRGL